MTDFTTLRPEPIPATAMHVCIDMQRLFGPGTPWALPWMPRVLPRIVEICARHAGRSVFTRFIPAQRAGEGQGAWRRYYEKWPDMTLDAIGSDMVRVVPELERFIPPAEAIDKPVYSPWLGSGLRLRLQARGCDAVAITGGETDMCVLAAVLGAVDLGYRVILVRDALCSASDEAHDAMLNLFGRRFGEQVEIATTAQLLAAWPDRE